MKKPFLNTFLFGLIAGLIIEIIAFYIILMLNKSIIGYTERSVFDFLSYLMDYDEGRSLIIPKLLSLSAIAGLLLFFIFIWTDRLKSARGVIASAFILGIAVVILKFF
jgi:hypothetical protein